MVILTSIAKVLIGLFIIALVLAFIPAIFLLGAIVAALGTATQPLFGRDREDDEPEIEELDDEPELPRMANHLMIEARSSRWRRSSGRNMCSIFAC